MLAGSITGNCVIHTRRRLTEILKYVVKYLMYTILTVACLNGDEELSAQVEESVGQRQLFDK